VLRPQRALSSQAARPAGEEHDPVKTRIIHVMVLGTFALSAYNILPYMGVSSVENSTKLLRSRDPMMQHAGADRLRYLASSSHSYRSQMLIGGTAADLVERAEGSTRPDVLEKVLMALKELLREEEGRRVLAGMPQLVPQLNDILQMPAGGSEAEQRENVTSLATEVLRDLRRPEMAE